MTGRSIEAEVAQQIAHQDRIKQVRARTGGEDMHPDHYDLREDIRTSVLAAFDAVSEDRGVPKVSDAELPNLFRAIDAIAERLFLKSVGL